MKERVRRFSSTPYILLYLTILCVPAIWPFLQSQFFPTQDYIYIARLQQMVVGLQDLQFPVRWVRDLRYGEPLFNFYAPLPYYFGALIKLCTDLLPMGLSYIWVTKVLFILAVIFSAFAMYLFSRTFFGKLGGMISALLYVYAPYHSVDMYVRGALSETWALVFFPLIFLSSYHLAKTFSRRNLLFFVLSSTGLFLTHNIMTLLFAPFMAIFMAVVSWRSIERYFVQGIGLLLSIGLSSFYLLPAFLEKDLVQPSALLNSYYDYRAHFVSIDQLIIPSWGYGPSLWGYEDGLSFQLGVLHWIVVGLSGIGLFFGIVLFLNAKKKISVPLTFKYPQVLMKNIWLYSTLMILFLGSLFMTHNQSTPIWKNVTLLQFSQFPWRFLGVAIFFGSFFGGFLLHFIPRFRLGFSVVFMLLIFSFYLSYFRPDFYYSFTDADFVSETELKNEQKLPKDYVPSYVKDFDREIVKIPNFTENSGLISDYVLKTGNVGFTVFSETGGTVEVPVYYFAGWWAFENGREIMIEEPDKYGLIRIPVSRGTNEIRLYFSNTLIRTVGNMISFISLIILVVYCSGRFRFLKR